MDFALSDIDTSTKANEGVEVPLKKLDGSPLLNQKKEPVALVLLGSDSRTVRRMAREISRKRVERLQKRRSEATSDEMLDINDREDIEMVARATTGWSGILDSKHKDIPFSFENCVDLYTKFPVAFEQAQAAIGDRSRFIQPSLEG